MDSQPLRSPATVADYGYDAPCALVIFAVIGAAGTIGAIVSRYQGDRIDIETDDMRALPFADGSFDLIVSSLAIHNIRGNTGRARAVAETWRVLKPGGRLAIADIRATSLYARTLHQLGATTTKRRLGWRFWYGNPIAATSLVTATKPLS